MCPDSRLEDTQAASDPLSGLAEVEVARRREAGLGNAVERRSSRSLGSILHANVFTRFNAIITSLAVVVLVFGHPIDAVFALVMVCNSAIGIVQELRARRSLERVQVLLVPDVEVRRDGAVRHVGPDDLVLGDIINIGAGDQIPVDGVVRSVRGLEVDESALTGESKPVPKEVDDDVLSGSFAVVGAAVIEATAVGENSWAHKLTAEAKTFVLTESELRVGIDRLLRVIGWILPPLSLLLVLSQLRLSSSLAEGLVWAVAGVVALVPQGLVLLVSMALAVAVIRLARANVVVQELPAVEGLARIDVLCVDKTGTLTTGRLAMDCLVPVEPASSLEPGLWCLTRPDGTENATSATINESLDEPADVWRPVASVPFSSVRKWSATEFEGHGAWYLGAPEILLDAAADDTARSEAQAAVEPLAQKGRRVLVVARADFSAGEELPADLRPVGVVALKEAVRPDAAETMRYFEEQHVQVRVISGDNPVTVAAVAHELGIPGAEHAVDLRNHVDLATIPPETVVFGRVLPDQKRDLVRLLQDRGHVVAMTGDGVNDIPSLKASDIGIAMDSATDATKSIAQLVLLDGRFDRLPGVVGEGRRVIANMERVSALFVTKTVYAALLALAVGVFGVAFPFLPRHLSLIATFTIGLPAFALSFRRADEPCRPGYLSRVMHFSVPAGVFAAVATFATYQLVQSPLANATLEEARTSATLALTLSGLFILYRLIRPVNRLEALLLVAMLVGFAVSLVPSPLADFYALQLPPLRVSVVMVGVLAVLIVALDAALTLADRIRSP